MSAPGPMTEAAFRAMVDESYSAASSAAQSSRYSDAAVAAAKAAGVVFAPEPVRLPERLVLTDSQLAGLVVAGEGVSPWIFRLAGRDVEDDPYVAERRLTAEAAIRRYNHFPAVLGALIRLNLEARLTLDLEAPSKGLDHAADEAELALANWRREAGQ